MTTRNLAPINGVRASPVWGTKYPESPHPKGPNDPGDVSASLPGNRQAGTAKSTLDDGRQTRQLVVVGFRLRKGQGRTRSLVCGQGLRTLWLFQCPSKVCFATVAEALSLPNIPQSAGSPRSAGQPLLADALPRSPWVSKAVRGDLVPVRVGIRVCRRDHSHGVAHLEAADARTVRFFRWPGHRQIRKRAPPTEWDPLWCRVVWWSLFDGFYGAVLKIQGRACLMARMLSLVILNSISMANGSPAAGS